MTSDCLFFVFCLLFVFMFVFMFVFVFAFVFVFFLTNQGDNNTIGIHIVLLLCKLR